MTARMENRDYGADCPVEEQAENAASIAAFLERCLELLHDRGRLGILLPDGNLSNPADRYIRECIAEKAAILGAVGRPPELFQPYANIKTSVLFLGKNGAQRSIFMAAAPTAGRDKKGRPLCRKDPATGREIPDDAVAEIARVARNPTRQEGENEPAATARGFRLQPEEIVNRIYLPGYYNPKLHQDLETLRNSGKYDLISIGELVGRK